MASNKERYLQETEQLLNKWEWLLEGIDGKEERLNTAMVLDSSYKIMIEKGQLPEGWLEKQLNEDEELNEAPNTIDSTFGNSTVIPRVIFPMIRRVMPDLIANKLVSVQPIQARTGIAYHIDYKYSNAKDGTGGKSFTGHPYSFEGNGVLPRRYTSEKFFAGAPNLAAGGTTTVNLTSAADGPLAFFKDYGVQVFADDAAVATFAAGITKRVEVYYRGVRNRALEEATTYSAVTTNLAIVLPQATGEFASLDAKQVVVYWLYTLEGSKYIPELEFTIGSKTIETHERKLKVRWTAEAEQDMQAYHKIDVEGELVKIASTEMNYEVDREIIDFIEDLIQPELSFAVQFGETRNAVQVASDPTTAGVTPLDDASGTLGVTFDQVKGIQGNYLDRHRRLAQLIFQLQAEMTVFNRQGGANWAVISPQVGALLKMLPGFEGEIAGSSLKIQEFGNLSGIQMYVDPNKKDRELVTLGLKTTNSNYGAGVVYAPYHSWMSSVVTNPENFDSIRGFFSRYAVDSFERGEWFYAGLTLDGVEYMGGSTPYTGDHGLRWV